MGEVVALGVPVSVPAGDGSDRVKTHDTSTFDLNATEHKHYRRNAGPALIIEPDAQVEVVEELGIDEPRGVRDGRDHPSAASVGPL